MRPKQVMDDCRKNARAVITCDTKMMLLIPRAWHPLRAELILPFDWWEMYSGCNYGKDGDSDGCILI